MITRVVHGWRVGGLIAYLMGPGRANEHVRPRVIATWDGRDAGWQPARVGPGDTDLDLGPLMRAMRAPAVAAGLPEYGTDGKRGYVWHLSARVAAGDRVLSDAEWAQVARELLHGAGVSTTGDHGGPRWVAIRHAEDHIHVAVVLVRQDTGRRFWPGHDYLRLRDAARAIERRLGLTLTAAGDGTAARAPSRGEVEKAARQGREPARVELARAVRAAAVTAVDPGSFAAALTAAGYVVALRHAPSGDVLGYKVARKGEVTAAGVPIFYSGSKLAADLSMPSLLRRWARSGAGVAAGDPVVAARARIGRARGALAGARTVDGADDCGVVHATRDVLTAIGPWSARLVAAEEMFDRAARLPYGQSAADGAAAGGLRDVARQLIRVRRLTRTRHDPDGGAVALLVALAALVTEIALWHRDRGRPHQSLAATRTAVLLDQAVRLDQPRPPEPALRRSRRREADNYSSMTRIGSSRT